MKLHNCSLVQAIEALNNNKYKLPAITSISEAKTLTLTRIEIIEATELCNPNLIKYLAARAVNLNTAKKYCKEIHYRVGDKTYYAIGFPNNSYGYVLRNQYFKGCLPPSDVSYVPNPSEQINLFEGLWIILVCLR